MDRRRSSGVRVPSCMISLIDARRLDCSSSVMLMLILILMLMLGGVPEGIGTGIGTGKGIRGGE